MSVFTLKDKSQKELYEIVKIQAVAFGEECKKALVLEARILELEKINDLFLLTLQNTGYPADLLRHDLKKLKEEGVCKNKT